MLMTDAWLVLDPSEAKDENNQLMDEVKKISHRIHAGLKRMSLSSLLLSPSSSPPPFPSPKDNTRTSLIVLPCGNVPNLSSIK